MTDQEFNEALERLNARRKEDERKELRDQFANAALQGMLANADLSGDVWKTSQRSIPEFGKLMASSAYQIADAMLKAREEK